LETKRCHVCVLHIGRVFQLTADHHRAALHSGDAVFQPESAKLRNQA
jgi:hypothetical protein